MKVAIAAENGAVSAHFGKCSEYIIADVSDDQVVGTTVLPNPGHEPGFLPEFLADHGVNVMIAGGMGPRAQALFDSMGVQTIVGIAGPVDDVINAFVRRDLSPYADDNLCDHDQTHS